MSCVIFVFLVYIRETPSAGTQDPPYQRLLFAWTFQQMPHLPFRAIRQYLFQSVRAHGTHWWYCASRRLQRHSATMPLLFSPPHNLVGSLTEQGPPRQRQRPLSKALEERRDLCSEAWRRQRLCCVLRLVTAGLHAQPASQHWRFRPTSSSSAWAAVKTWWGRGASSGVRQSMYFWVEDVPPLALAGHTVAHREPVGVDLALPPVCAAEAAAVPWQDLCRWTVCACARQLLARRGLCPRLRLPSAKLGHQRCQTMETLLERLCPGAHWPRTCRGRVTCAARRGGFCDGVRQRATAGARPAGRQRACGR